MGMWFYSKIIAMGFDVVGYGRQTTYSSNYEENPIG